MINDFLVTSYVGVGPINFGMNRTQVNAILGLPERSRKSKFGPKVIDYWLSEDVTVIFDAANGNASEINFGITQLAAEVHGVRLFERSGPDIYRELCLLDGGAMTDVGITVLFNMGITLDGFLATEQEQRVVSVFEKGVWSKRDPRLKPVRV